MTTLGNYKIEYSTDSGTTWTDVSGDMTKVEPGGGERGKGEVYTLNADSPEVIAGPRASVEIGVSAIYKDGASDVAMVIWDLYENKTAAIWKLTPDTGSTNTLYWESDTGYVTAATPPSKEGGSSDPLLMEFTITVGKLTKKTA